MAHHVTHSLPGMYPSELGRGRRTHHLLQQLVGGERKRNAGHHLDVVRPQPLHPKGFTGCKVCLDW